MIIDNLIPISSRRIQISTLRQSAIQLLKAYDLQDYKITLIQHYHNATFRIKTRRGQYMFRLSRDGYQNEGTIISEMEWLRAIIKVTDLIVPQPVSTIVGNEVSSEMIDGRRHLGVLLRWIDGEFRYKKLSYNSMVQWGIFIGRLHKFSQSFQPTTSFSRLKWDVQRFLGFDSPGIDQRRSLDCLGPDGWAVIEEVGKLVEFAMASIGFANSTYGMIHADLSYQNVIFTQNTLGAIDFDNCGWGFYLYDIGVSLSTLRYHPNIGRLAKGLIDGYKKIINLSEEEFQFIDIFTAAHLLSHTVWLANNVHDPNFGVTALKQVYRQIQELQQFHQYRSNKSASTIKSVC